MEMIDMKDITPQEMFDLCNVDKANADFESDLVETLIKENIPGQYRTENNDKFFKYWLTSKYPIMGLRYLLHWQSQNGVWLTLASNFLFNLPRATQGISLTDEEMRLSCQFATICLNLNARDAKQFYHAFDLFDGNIIVIIDPITQTQTYYYNSDKISLDFLVILNKAKLMPDLLGFNSRWVGSQKPIIFFRSIGMDAEDYYPNLSDYYNDDGTPKDNIQNIINDKPLPLYSRIRDVSQEPYQDYFFKWSEYGSVSFI